MFFDADPKTTAPFNPIFPVMGLISLSASIFFYRNLIAKIDKTASDDIKINMYQSAFIISSALLEGGALFNIVGFFMTRNSFFLIFGAANFIFLVLKRPTRDKLISTLQLQHPNSGSL